MCNKKIENLREKLYKLIDVKEIELTDDKIVKASEELDEALNSLVGNRVED
ncbi:aspartyl-phosphate phosphatase Spo0E family protein [Clostridium thailandense]|uniref:aspartyl-phosphate phosphatase Spo0E family protein n=1 Tax=Clostridium thailandense TaxID=2794346 RepID=UPI001FE8272F|nr:aspartyl-phosphate phosphatase Spo0E family protein [Clostridium thailandense]